MSSVRERATLVDVPTTLRVITSTARAPHWTIEEAVTEIDRRRQLAGTPDLKRCKRVGHFSTELLPVAAISCGVWVAGRVPNVQPFRARVSVFSMA